MGKIVTTEVQLSAYRDRNETLRLLGFPSYKNYLGSRLWKLIKERAFQIHGRICRVCKGEATQIHHASYLRDVLMGEDVRALIPLCGRCHFVGSRTERNSRTTRSYGIGIRALGETNVLLGKRAHRKPRKRRRRSR